MEQSVLAFITPGRERKEHYGEATVPSYELGEPREKGPPPMTASSFSSDELVIISSQDTQEASDDEHLVTMMGQWGLIVSALKHSTTLQV